MRKRVLVLGAESDLGRTVALSLVRTGDIVAVFGLSKDPARMRALGELRQSVKVYGGAIDRRDGEAVRSAIEWGRASLGRFDAIVLIDEPLASGDFAAARSPEAIADKLRELKRMMSEERVPNASNEDMLPHLSVFENLITYAGPELDRRGGAPFVVVSDAVWWIASLAAEPEPKWWMEEVRIDDKAAEQVADEVRRAVHSLGIRWKLVRLTPTPLRPMWQYVARLFGWA